MTMDELMKKLNNDLAREVMAREDARRSYQGEQKIERMAKHDGKIEYISELMDYIKKLS